MKKQRRNTSSGDARVLRAAARSAILEATGGDFKQWKKPADTMGKNKRAERRRRGARGRTWND